MNERNRSSSSSLLGGAMGLLVVASAAAWSSCGGAPKNGGKAAAKPADAMPEMTAEDVTPRAVVVSAELTTEVDEQRYLATGPILQEFPPAQKAIFLVGKLKRVPTQARIEVRWFRDADPKPLLVSKVIGSDTFSFVASLHPTGRTFIPGPYSARVFVDDREVGGPSFTVTGVPPSVSGAKVTGLKISTAVGGKMKPKSPSSQFRSGVKKLYATFAVESAAEGARAAVQWFRAGEPFHEETVDVAPAGRFGAEVTAPDGLPDGEYTVVVALDGAELVETGFQVGDVAAVGSGPRVDRLAFGRAIGADNMPTAEVEFFSRQDDAVRCGLRFLDLPPGSEISIQWTAVGDSGSDPIVYHTTKSAVPSGGSGTMAAEWRQPASGFEPGRYKVSVLVGGAVLAEREFTIE
jgi:hypothetical protein